MNKSEKKKVSFCPILTPSELSVTWAHVTEPLRHIAAWKKCIEIFSCKREEAKLGRNSPSRFSRQIFWKLLGVNMKPFLLR